MHSSDMKRFLAKLGIFLALLLIILGLFEIGFRAKKTTFKCKFEGLEKYASEVEVLGLGHSHTNEGFAPEAFDCRAFNMAMGFQNVFFDDYVLSHFIGRMDSLKCVILATSYFHFFNELGDLEELRGEDLFNTVKYHLYWGVDEIKGSRIPHWSPKYNLEILNNPATSYFTMFKYYLTGEAWNKKTKQYWDTISYSGFVGQDIKVSESYLDENGKKDARAHTWSGVAEAVNYEIYEHIVQCCRERGVNIALMLYPCWHSYYDNMDGRQIAYTRELMDRLASKYDNCYVFDYLEDPRFEAEDFHDATHLNKKGAEKISSIINSELKDMGNI